VSDAPGPDTTALDADTVYVAKARAILNRLRRCTHVPILLHNLQVPTVAPLGRADHGLESHKTRVRAHQRAARSARAKIRGRPRRRR
jgi:hypothetical protein